MEKTSEKAWSGRFKQKQDVSFEAFSCSLKSDMRLLEADILQNKAWAEALKGIGIFSAEEFDSVCTGLDDVASELSQDDVFAQGIFTEGDEDIHMVVERLLTARIGAVGAKLHTGRSRNDQVATDTRLLMKSLIDAIETALEHCCQQLIMRAEDCHDVIFAGFTHLRPAQPIRFSYYLLSWVWPLMRHIERLGELKRRVDVMPLGAGAMAGSGFAVDRQLLKERLGFAAISRNGIDAVSSRDYLIESAHIANLICLDFSRLSEDLILYSSPICGYIQLSDAYCTGSSIMPQKKNPDALELIRGYCGRATALVTELSVMVKGLPSTYNRDMQWDKPHCLDLLSDLPGIVAMITGVLATYTLQPKRLQESVVADAYATELADFLAKNGLPFRQAHHVVGRIVADCEQTGKALTAMNGQSLQVFDDRFVDLPSDWCDPQTTCDRRNIPGGTGRDAVVQQLQEAKEQLALLMQRD